jgi:hypothetical protein
MHVVVAPAVMAVAMPAAMVPAFTMVRGGFVERKFLADADIQFAHSVSMDSGFAPGRPCLAAGGDIIIKSSNVNLTVVSQFEFSVALLRNTLLDQPLSNHQKMPVSLLGIAADVARA